MGTRATHLAHAHAAGLIRALPGRARPGAFVPFFSRLEEQFYMRDATGRRVPKSRRALELPVVFPRTHPDTGYPATPHAYAVPPEALREFDLLPTLTVKASDGLVFHSVTHRMMLNGVSHAPACYGACYGGSREGCLGSVRRLRFPFWGRV